MSVFHPFADFRRSARLGTMRRLLVFLLLPVFAGCTPNTGDALVDEVAERVAPFSDCVRVGKTQIFSESNETGPPASLLARSFENVAAQTAAEKVARPWQQARHDSPKFFGKGSPDACALAVNAPVYADDFAFLTYSEPGGIIGAYAFRRDGSDWRKVEDIRLGYW